MKNHNKTRSYPTQPWFSRDTYQDRSGKDLSFQKWIAFLGVLIFFVAVLSRSWDNFIQPGLHAEDTTHFFNFFYGNIRTLQETFHTYNGYHVLLSKFATYLIAKADITWQPYLYQFYCLGLCTLTIIAFSFSGLITNRYLLLFGPLLLGLSGLNHLYYFLAVSYQMYVVTILLFILLLWRRRVEGPTGILLLLVLLLLIWSGPYSVLIVPFCLTYLALFRDRKLLCLTLIIATLVYTFSVEEVTIMFENLLKGKILALWGESLIKDVFFMGFKKSVNIEKTLLVVTIFSAIIILLRKDRHYLKSAFLILVLIIASLAPLFLSNKYLLYQSIYPSHLVIAQFFWLLLILVTFERILGRFPRWETVGSVLLMSAALLFVVVDNIKHPHKVRAEIFTDVPKFTKIIAETEALQLAEKGERVVITTKRAGDFNAIAVVGDRSKNATKKKRIRVQ